MLDVGIDGSHRLRGLIALQDTSVTADQELGEVPLDVILFVVVGILLAQHAVHHLATLVGDVKTSEALLGLQIGVERMLIGTVDINLVELQELDVEVGRAELVDFLDGALCSRTAKSLVLHRPSL